MSKRIKRREGIFFIELKNHVLEIGFSRNWSWNLNQPVEGYPMLDKWFTLNLGWFFVWVIPDFNHTFFLDMEYSEKYND